MDSKTLSYSDMDKVIISDLEINCIIGIHPEERVRKQKVLVNLTLFTDFTKAIESEDIENAVNYQLLSEDIIHMVESSSFLLVEKLASEIACLCLNVPAIQALTLKVEKPEALDYTRSVGVEIFRKKESI